VVLQVYRIHYKEEAGTPSKLLEKNWKTGIITHPFPPFLHAYLPVHRVYVAIIMVEEVSVEGLGGSYKGVFLSAVGHDVMDLSL